MHQACSGKFNVFGTQPVRTDVLIFENLLLGNYAAAKVARIIIELTRFIIKSPDTVGIKDNKPPIGGALILGD